MADNAERAADNLNNVSNAVNDLNNSMDSLDSKRDALKNMTVGTSEWSKAVNDLNSNVMESIENFNDTDSKYNTVAYDNLELEQFKTVLEQFYISMTNAMAYSVINCNRFNDTRIKNSLDAIKENLGISTSYSGNSNKSSGGSFFSKNSSYDDIKDNISAMED